MCEPSTNPDDLPDFIQQWKQVNWPFNPTTFPTMQKLCDFVLQTQAATFILKMLHKAPSSAHSQILFPSQNPAEEPHMVIFYQKEGERSSLYPSQMVNLALCLQHPTKTLSLASDAWTSLPCVWDGAEIAPPQRSPSEFSVALCDITRNLFLGTMCFSTENKYWMVFSHFWEVCGWKQILFTVWKRWQSQAIKCAAFNLESRDKSRMWTDMRVFLLSSWYVSKIITEFLSHVVLLFTVNFLAVIIINKN